MIHLLCLHTEDERSGLRSESQGQGASTWPAHRLLGHSLLESRQPCGQAFQMVSYRKWFRQFHNVLNIYMISLGG